MVYELITDSAANTYVLRTKFESLSGTSCDAINKDGNPTSDYYELGTDPGLDL